MYPNISQYRILFGAFGSHTSELQGTKIRSIRNGKCLENTPGETLDDATYKEHFQASREEWNEDGTDHEDHAANHGFFVSDPFCDVAVDDETKDASNLPNHVS